MPTERSVIAEVVHFANEDRDFIYDGVTYRKAVHDAAQLTRIATKCDETVFTSDNAGLDTHFANHVSARLATSPAEPVDWSVLVIRHVPSGGGWTTSESGPHAYPIYNSDGTWYVVSRLDGGTLSIPSISLA